MKAVLNRAIVTSLIGLSFLTSPSSVGWAKSVTMIDNTFHGDWLYNPREYDRERFFMKRMREVKEDDILRRIRTERFSEPDHRSRKKKSSK
jgi:hypothetical protein